MDDPVNEVVQAMEKLNLGEFDAAMEKLNEAHKNGIVIGLKDFSSDPVPRMDIDDMILKFPEMFNLLVIALLELMVVDVPWDIPEEYRTTKKDKFSYFQIAGTFFSTTT